jgi:hypothetical protein
MASSWSIHMESPVKLISVRQISSPTSENEIVWEYQTNRDPWDNAQTSEWTPYPAGISSVVEQAFQSGTDQATIGDLYSIDFRELAQISIEKSSRQRPIRRLHLKSSVETDVQAKTNTARRERLMFPPLWTQSIMVHDLLEIGCCSSHMVNLT